MFVALTAFGQLPQFGLKAAWGDLRELHTRVGFMRFAL